MRSQHWLNRSNFIVLGAGFIAMPVARRREMEREILEEARCRPLSAYGNSCLRDSGEGAGEGWNESELVALINAAFNAVFPDAPSKQAPEAKPGDSKEGAEAPKAPRSTRSARIEAERNARSALSFSGKVAFGGCLHFLLAFRDQPLLVPFAPGAP